MTARPRAPTGPAQPSATTRHRSARTTLHPHCILNNYLGRARSTSLFLFVLRCSAWGIATRLHQHALHAVPHLKAWPPLPPLAAAPPCPPRPCPPPRPMHPSTGPVARGAKSAPSGWAGGSGRGGRGLWWGLAGDGSGGVRGQSRAPPLNPSPSCLCVASAATSSVWPGFRRARTRNAMSAVPNATARPVRGGGRQKGRLSGP